MNKFFQIVNVISRVLAWIGVALIVVLAAMYTADVFGRLVLGRQIKGTFEVAQFLLCLISFASYSLTQTNRSHIHVGFIVSRFPKRMKYAAAALSFTLCTLMCIIVAYGLLTQGGLASSSNKLTQVLELPFAPIYYMAAVAMFLFALTLIADILRSVMALFGNEEARASIDKVYM